MNFSGAGFMDASAVDAEVIDLTSTAEPGFDPAERKLMDELTRAAELPDWARRLFERVQDLRNYLEEEVYEFDDDNAVNVNVLGRMLSAKAGQVWPERPACLLRSQDQGGQQTAQQAMHRAWVKVANKLVNWHAEKAQLEDDIQAAVIDAGTDGLVWLKAEWAEDPARDPLGTPRADDAQDQYQRMYRLAQMAAAGEITDSDSEWQDLRDLVRLHRENAEKLAASDPRQSRLLQAIGNPEAENLGLLPEPMHFAGLEVSAVPVEHVRLDWENVSSLERMHKGRWVIEISYQQPDEIADRYSLSREELQTLKDGTAGNGARDHQENAGNPGQGSNTADAKDRDAEASEHGNTKRVFCCWHRLNRRRYVWVEGIHRFLRNESYAGPAPFVPFAFSHTPKRPIPVSIGLAGWKLQREINQMLTEGKQARRARYPKYGIKRGVASVEDLLAITQCVPHGVVEMDEPEELKKAIEEFKGTEYDPRLFDPSGHMRLMEIEMGVTMQQVGLSSSGSTATEVERAAAGAAATNNMHQGMLYKALRKLYALTLGYVAEYVDPERVAFIISAEDAQIWAAFPKDREQIAAGLKVDILAADNGAEAQMAQAKAWTVTADSLARVGQAKVTLAQAGESLNTSPIFEAITEGMGLGISGDELVQKMPPPQPGMMPQGQPGGNPGGMNMAAGLSGQP